MPKYYSSLCGIEGKSLLAKLYTQKTYIIHLKGETILMLVIELDKTEF